MESNEGGSTGSMGAGTATMSGTSSSQGPSPSTSIEVNSPKSNNGFSSKGLSMFKDVGSFNTEKPMIDIAKPSFEDHIEPHHESPKPEVSQKNSIIDINHGKDEKSFFNRPESFNAKPGIIDISKPFQEEKVESHKSSENNTSEEKTPTPKPTELKPNTAFHFSPNLKTETKTTEVSNPESMDYQDKESKDSTIEKSEPEQDAEPRNDNSEKAVEHEVSKFENSEPKHETINRADVSTAEKHEEVTHPELLASEKTEIKAGYATSSQIETKTSEKTEPQPQVEIKKGHASSTSTDMDTDTQTMHEMVIVKSETKSAVSTSVKEDIQFAQKELLPQLQRQEKASVTKVREAIAIELAKENPDEIELTEELEELSKTEKVDKNLESKIKAIFQKRKLQKQGFQKPELPDDKGKLYLKKDKDTNQYREMMISLAAERTLLRKGSVDGKDLSDTLKIDTDNVTSEIVRGVQKDGSLEEVMREVGNLGKFTEIIDIRRAVKGIVEKITAVKLSARSGADGATKKDAKKVYQKDLDMVGANLKEENSHGTLVKSINGETVYVSGQRKIGEPLEDELYNSAA